MLFLFTVEISQIGSPPSSCFSLISTQDEEGLHVFKTQWNTQSEAKNDSQSYMHLSMFILKEHTDTCSRIWQGEPHQWLLGQSYAVCQETWTQALVHQHCRKSSLGCTELCRTPSERSLREQSCLFGEFLGKLHVVLWIADAGTGLWWGWLWALRQLWAFSLLHMGTESRGSFQHQCSVWPECSSPPRAQKW